MIRFAIGILAVFAVSGCNEVEGTSAVHELALVQKMPQQDAAAHVPRCRLGQEDCVQVHQITGDACLHLAAERLSAGDAGPYADCATARFAALNTQGQSGFLLRGLEARRLQRESRTELAASRRENDLLAAQAARINTRQAGFYAASATDWRNSFVADAPCADLQQAAESAWAAATADIQEAIDNRQAAAAMSARLNGLLKNRGCQS
ncbi:hypothetical protein [Paracoccus laeviglucosivorans]|uniref:Uncharacterized protein n=1 Tax=Paracoccus laeviglucosivorans TaxID=1197861 RepID=A0A521FCU3_9RHOB|nr:hypothetical protein [Paracoccus laeviglucosivorans]SMO93985.1 hypothetical protein SAMN06265221_12056 [Paracoccus laeviglucosivorans]